MFAWYPYARPMAVALWAGFVQDAAFEDWIQHWEIGDEEAPMDFFIEDKRARFALRGKLGGNFSLRDADQLAEAASNYAKRTVGWLRIDNSGPVSGVVTVTFELARLRTTAKGFKEVAA